MALLDSTVKLRAFQDGRRADPIGSWRFSVSRLREAFGLFSSRDPIRELHARACNKGGKTESAAAFVIACCQKRKHLDGCPLPQWRGPVEAAQFVLDYKLQILSVQAAYERLLGTWPHRASRMGEHLSALHIMPEHGDPDDESGWSVIHFLSQKNKLSGTGARADIAAFDEPPIMDILREMRKASHAGRLGIRIIGETPTVMSQWLELREDYGETPRSSIRRVDTDRAEVRWSLDECGHLTEREKAELRRSYAREPYLKDAREHGDYSITEGQHPFDVEVLSRMLAQCREPERVDWNVQQEKTDAGMVSVATVQVEVWRTPEIGKTYYIDIDPASGVADRSHNPLGALVLERGSGNLCARFNGRIAPYSMGRLVAGLGRQYHMAVVDIEMNDHWGVNVYKGLRDSHYQNIAIERKLLRPGEMANEIGWRANAQAKADAVGEIQNWIAAWNAGAPYADCPSSRIIASIMDCVLDESGKIVPGQDIHGGHGEDVVLWGHGLRRCVTNTGRRAQALLGKGKTADEQLVDWMREQTRMRPRGPSELARPALRRPK